MTFSACHGQGVSELTLLAALFPDAHVDLDGRALETESLAEPAGDEPAVAGVQETGGEQHELRRPAGGLGAKEDAGLLAAADGVRVRATRGL